MGKQTPNLGGLRDISDTSLKQDILRVEPAPHPAALQPSKFSTMDQQYQRETDEFLSNEVLSQKNAAEDITPAKPALNIMHLLSNLDGLTPDGLAHLMETQDRMAATSKTAPLVQNEALDEAKTQFCSDNSDQKDRDKYRQSSIDVVIEQPLTSRLQKSQSLCAKPFPSQRDGRSGSRTVRQALNFVDVSDDKNMAIPSPAPSVPHAGSSIATPVVSSRFIANNRDVQNAQKKLQYDTLSDGSSNNLLTRPISATLSSSTTNQPQTQIKSFQ